MSNASRSESRDDYIVRVAAIHTTEGGGTAAALRDADWWEGSAHAIFGDGPDSDPDDFTKNDADEVTPLNGGVPYDRAAWTLRSGNRWSVNAELIGYAAWTREQWLARWRQLNRVALWLADMHKRFNIPLQKITAKQYKAGMHGVIGHIDHTEAYGGPSGDGGTHWDPGPGFPYDVVIDKAKQYLAAELEPNMTPEQAKQLDDLHHAVCEPVINGLTLAGALRKVLDGVVEKQKSLVKDKDGKPVVTTDLDGFVRYVDRHAYELNREKVPELLELVAETRQAVEQVLDAVAPAPTTAKK